MKKLKRYQYERYAVLCNLAYSTTFNHTLYGFAENGQRIIANRFGQPMIRVLWGEDTNEVVVVIKGSHNVWDWLLNLAVWQRPCSTLNLPYSIHAGYHYQIHQNSQLNTNEEQVTTASVFDTLLQTLVPLIQRGKLITFTGHSSGGAISTVLADAIETRFSRSVKRVVTFGQPAAGGNTFKCLYGLNHKTYRVCCDLDVVTFMPPLPFLYRHVGKLLWLYNGKIYENTPTIVRLTRSIGSWLLRPFSYHLMDRYIRNKDFFDKH